MTTTEHRGTYVATFDLVLTRLEEAMCGERPADGAATIATLVERLEVESGAPAPEAVRTARDSVVLHARLLDWQDQLERRDGARRHQAEVRRPPNVIGVASGALRLGRVTLSRAQRHTPVRPLGGRGGASGRSAA